MGKKFVTERAPPTNSFRDCSGPGVKQVGAKHADDHTGSGRSTPKHSHNVRSATLATRKQYCRFEAHYVELFARHSLPRETLVPALGRQSAELTIKPNSVFAAVTETYNFLVNGEKTEPGRYPTYVSLRDHNSSSSSSSSGDSSSGSSTAGNYYYTSTPPPYAPPPHQAFLERRAVQTQKQMTI